MRKFLLTAAFSGLAAALFAAPAIPGKVTANILNMRMQPTLKSSVAGKIRNGQELAITGKKGMWLEIVAPESVKVYVDEAYISNGKTLRDLNMYPAMDRKAPVYGKLAKGTEVKVTKERGWGWVRILPPENLKVYIASTYVAYDSTALANMLAELKAEAAKEQPAPAPEKPAVQEEKKAEVPAPAPAAKIEKKAAVPAEKAEKPAVKAVEKKAEKPAAKIEKKAEKPAAAPAKKAEKPAAKAVEKKAEKPVAKIEKKAEKPAAKIEKKAVKAEKKAVKTAKKAAAPFRADDPRVKALSEFGVDVMKEKPRTVKLEGHLFRIPASVNIATNYAVGGDNRKNLGFICAEEDGMVSPFVDQRVTITGREFKIKGWKAPIIWLDEIDKAK